MRMDSPLPALNVVKELVGYGHILRIRHTPVYYQVSGPVDI